MVMVAMAMAMAMVMEIAIAMAMVIVSGVCDGYGNCGERCDGGGLDLPSGKGEPGETPRPCASREVGEGVAFAEARHAQTFADRLLDAPSVCFDFRWGPKCHRITLFLIEWDSDLMAALSLIADGQSEMTDPGWRRIADIQDSIRHLRWMALDT